nr:uncharacterized protein LOC126541305 [Dermacentor andersoni]
MAICQGHRAWQQQRHSHLHHTEMSAPSTYSHVSEDAGGDSKRTDSTAGGFNLISTALPSVVPPFSDVVPASVSSLGLLLPFGPGHCFIKEVDCACVTGYWTGNCKAKFEMQVPSILHNHDNDVLHKTKYTRSMQRPEPRGRQENIRDHNRSATSTPNGRIGDDVSHDGALHHTRNIEGYGNAQLDPAIVGRDPWEELEHAKNGPVATTFAIQSLAQVPDDNSHIGAALGVNRGLQDENHRCGAPWRPQLNSPSV